MSVPKLKSKMQKDLDAIQSKLTHAETEAERANSRVYELRREQKALQSALDILDGKIIPSAARPNPSPGLFIPPVVSNEAGFIAGKDAEGNDILIPDLGFVPPAPVIDLGLPAAAPADFVNPEDLV